MEFKEYKPKKLNNLVLSIFERKVNYPLQVQMLPDFTISLIFYLGDKIRNVLGKEVNSNIFNPTETFCFITGLHTEPLYFEMEGLHSIGINMRPSAIKAFWNIPVEELKDYVIPWDMSGDLDFIENSIKSLSSFQERALWIEDFFFEKIKNQDISLGLKLHQLALLLEKDVFTGQKTDVLTYSGYSKMHTNRLFKEWLGLSPGKLIRYKQFLKAIDLIHRSTMNLTEVGYACGFYDQAHFIRVFKEFSAMTPGQYLEQKSRIPGILLK